MKKLTDRLEPTSDDIMGLIHHCERLRLTCSKLFGFLRIMLIDPNYNYKYEIHELLKKYGELKE